MERREKVLRDLRYQIQEAIIRLSTMQQEGTRLQANLKLAYQLVDQLAVDPDQRDLCVQLAAAVRTARKGVETLPERHREKGEDAVRLIADAESLLDDLSAWYTLN
jgi:hypothetical protein